MAEAYRRGEPDTTYVARAAAVVAVGAYGVEQARPLLTAALGDKEWAVRLRAAQLLKQLDPTSDALVRIRPAPALHPELYDACVYYDREVELPNPKGFPSVRKREGFCCENPLCNCVSLRNEGHHWKLRKHGGSNAPTNAGCLCKPCHRRGIHAGAFTRETDAKGRDVWTYLSGRRVMVF